MATQTVIKPDEFIPFVTELQTIIDSCCLKNRRGYCKHAPMHTNKNLNFNRLIQYLTIISITAISLVGQACSGEASQAEAALEEYLKARGVKEITVDMFTKDPNNSNKAYMSATLVHNFASADGKPQKEHRGYILAKSEDKWAVESSEKYTTQTQTALRYLAGLK